MPNAPEQPRSNAISADSRSGEAMRAAVERQMEKIPDKKSTPPTIPDHVLLHRIGSGAYGEVWLARNALGTLRAVKVVYRVRFEEDRPYEREFNGILKYEPISRTHEGLVQASRPNIEFWSTTNWQRTRAIPKFNRILYGLDDRTWWLTEDFRTAGLYDARTMQPLLPLPTGTLPLAVSPDGRYLAVSVDLRRLQVWDLAEVREQFMELGLGWNEGETASLR